MLNGYFDILPRGLFTPYVGAGIGFVYNDIQRYRFNQETGDLAAPPPFRPSDHPSAAGAKEQPEHVGLAGALMGGISFAFDQRWALDVNYRAQYLAGGPPP